MDDIHWCVADSASPQITHKATLSTLNDIPEQHKKKPCIVFVPNTQVTTQMVSIPSKNKKNLLKAIPYALEDHLACDIDQCHFALGPRINQSQIVVNITDRKIMQNWMDKLVNSGIKQFKLMPIGYALPHTEHTLSLAVDKMTTLVRLDNFKIISIDNENLDPFLKLIIEENPDIEQVNIVSDNAEITKEYFKTQFIPPEDKLSSSKQATQLSFKQPPIIDYKHVNLFDYFCLHTPKTLPINLIQGEFLPKKSAISLKPWIPVIVIISIAIILQMLLTQFQINQTQQLIKQYDQKIVQTYKSTFPRSRKIVDIKIQFQQKLNALKQHKNQPENFIDLLAKSSQLLKTIKISRINDISYRQGELQLNILLKNVQEIEKLRQQFKASSLSISIKSNIQSNVVNSRIIIKKR